MPSNIPVDWRVGRTIAIKGTMSIPSPGIPVLVVPTITAQKATTTQPNKFKSNAHLP
jgi:hypothetical protein